MEKKDTRLHLRVNSEQVERLTDAAAIFKMPISEFVRKAIDEKLAKAAKRHPELQREAA